MISTHAEKAAELFKAGYNCSQSVAAAFCDVTKTDEKTMLATAAPFAGGFGRNREVCGAISGGCLVLGLLYGYTDPSDKTAKSEHYALVRDFMARFSVRFGSVICRELLGGATAGGEPAERNAAFYESRPCFKLVFSAAEIIDEIINENGV